MQKIAEQFDMDWSHHDNMEKHPEELAEERGTLLFILDAYNKYLFDTDSSSARKSREVFDQLIKEFLKNNPEKNNKILFRIRQYFNSHRIEEYTYVQKTFEDFRAIIWEFVEHLGEEITSEKSEDEQINHQLSDLRNAVESNSIVELKKCSREFIDLYVEVQTKRDQRKEHKLTAFKKNLQIVKKKLMDTEDQVKKDHLTGAYNRKKFDEIVQQLWSLFKIYQTPVTLVTLDIDHFKKINDNYGHDMGDHILKEFVKIIKDSLSLENQVLCRVGGEEFAILLPNFKVEHAIEKANEIMNHIRKETFVKDDAKIQFTASLGIAELKPNESVEEWIKRADIALYNAKKTGRNKFIVADTPTLAA